jgi:ADP-heptose:LPS heptosyltransferase
MQIILKSFAGIGDLLLQTPSLSVIKEAYPGIQIVVNTLHGDILAGNPFISKVGKESNGFFPSYPDPRSGILPTTHHILAIWRLICAHFSLETPSPKIKPELYVPGIIYSDDVLVQVLHRNQWGGKKVWPHFEELISFPGYSEIPRMNNIRELVMLITGASCVVCADGLISHIAAAVGTPAVVIYGGFLRPEWSGYPFHRNLLNHLDCSPCYNTYHCSMDKQCLREITVEQVMRSVVEARDKN